MTQSSKTLGKTAGKDQNDNKPTIPALIGLEAAQKYVKQISQELTEKVNGLPYDTMMLKEFVQKLVIRTY